MFSSTLAALPIRYVCNIFFIVLHWYTSLPTKFQFPKPLSSSLYDFRRKFQVNYWCKVGSYKNFIVAVRISIVYCFIFVFAVLFYLSYYIVLKSLMWLRKKSFNIWWRKLKITMSCEHLWIILNEHRQKQVKYLNSKL